MSTAVWPPIAPDQLLKEEQASQARELEWLLSSLQETLQSLKAGLEECAALLAPTEHGSTLVLSTHRSESLKGFVTRVGTRIVKGDIKLRLQSLPPPRGAASYDLTISAAPTAPTLVLGQLTTTRTAINTALDVVDVTRWAGNTNDASYISGQLQLLHDNIVSAQDALKGYSHLQKEWWEQPADEKIFSPPLPPTLDLHFSIHDSALLLTVRTLEPVSPTPTSESFTGFSIRKGLVAALGGARIAAHDEANDTFQYRGQDVKVKDKVRVESQDPSLIAVMVKLSALEHQLHLAKRALDVVMGRDE
ncbi:hypothetical protein H2201_003956 [Coniosporium apollinis]|uniref:RAVE subunit 2/Rogdi n=2 Tax=Coniosporium TaxID=2810619 RepID=A0ABQ9NUN3_9PEZI|nr:hypothetical protein H2199_005544 [Cladosporium sp. JES 115]KAJ9665832.1 hypothetical protein H2201_003956 [Coniosporium apollinis]